MLKGENALSDETIYSAINKTIRTCRIHRNLIDSRVGEIGIPRTAHRALMHLAKNGRLTSQRELAEHLEITPAAVTGVLQRLESEGYIKRTLGADNRFNEISITEKGRKTVELSCEAFRKVDRSLFDGLEDEEIDTFIEIISKIKKNAEKCEAEWRAKQGEKMV